MRLSPACAMAALIASGVAASGCASQSAAKGPAWFEARRAQLVDAYPDITAVPSTRPPTRDAAQAAAATAEIKGAQAALERAAPAAPGGQDTKDAQGFDAGARAEIEAARPK